MHSPKSALDRPEPRFLWSAGLPSLGNWRSACPFSKRNHLSIHSVAFTMPSQVLRIPRR
jgi:hypothetical protein